MTGYFYGKDMKIFDYSKFSQPLTEKVRENAERIAKEQGLKIEFIRKTQAFRKDDRIQGIIKEKGMTEGLVHIFSAMESCNTYRPWHDKETGRTFFKFDVSKCLHYYFYFLDRELGLCYLRVPTWCPFRLQFYMNGHNLLASKLDKRGIEYELVDNAFINISDVEVAQKLSDRINPENLHKALDVFAKRYCPVASELEMSYSWTIMQIECATDIMFKKQDYLQPIYDEIIKTAIHTVKPDNIATFLGQRITYNCKKEAGNNFNQRILGTRIKHHMGDVSIKMYDKFGLVLRIESTCNDVGAFRVLRDVQHNDGTITAEKAPMKKTIYSLYQLFTIMKAANYRYLEFISSFDDHSDGEKALAETSKSVEENGRSYRGFNFFDMKDLKILGAIDRGEFNIQGFQNRDIRKRLVNVSSPAMSRIFKRLRLHGLIEKIKDSYNYLLTALGKSVVAAGLKVRNLVIVPELAQV
jgi:DNA-binding MarR family transcriptional regulator